MMAWFRSSRRLSLKTVLRDATVVLAGTVLGILLSHMFFTDSSTSSASSSDLETLCAENSNARLPHLAKRSEESLKHLRLSSRLAQKNQAPPPRPLPAIWGAVTSKIEAQVATYTGREKGTLAAVNAAASESGEDDGDRLEELNSGSGSAVEGSGHPQVATRRFEDSTVAPQTTENERNWSDSPALENQNQRTENEKSRFHNSLIIGVHASNPDGYAAVRKTWGSYAQKLVYFSSMKEQRLEEERREDAPVINLSKRVDDDHSHQLRPNAYQLLKYMHDNFINDFDWFMRTSDNVYVRVEQLTNHLAKLDPNQEQCFGYPPDSGGHQKIDSDIHMKEGSPVSIFSRGLLKKLGPHLEECLTNVSSTLKERDVEKCLRERATFQCGGNSEITKLFLTDVSKGEMFSHLDAQATHQQLEASLVIYPIPSLSLMFKVHQFYLEVAIDKLKHRTNQLFSELGRLASVMSS